MARRTRSAASWTWRWLAVIAYVLVLAAVAVGAVVGFFEYLAGRRSATYFAAIAAFVSGVMAFQVSGPQKRNPWLWSAVLLIAMIGTAYAFEWFGMQHRGRTSSIAMFALFGAVAGAGLRLFWLLEQPAPACAGTRENLDVAEGPHRARGAVTRRGN